MENTLKINDQNSHVILQTKTTKNAKGYLGVINKNKNSWIKLNKIKRELSKKQKNTYVFKTTTTSTMHVKNPDERRHLKHLKNCN